MTPFWDIMVEYDCTNHSMVMRSRYFHQAFLTLGVCCVLSFHPHRRHELGLVGVINSTFSAAHLHRKYLTACNPNRANIYQYLQIIPAKSQAIWLGSGKALGSTLNFKHQLHYCNGCRARHRLSVCRMGAEGPEMLPKVQIKVLST